MNDGPINHLKGFGPLRPVLGVFSSGVLLLLLGASFREGLPRYTHHTLSYTLRVLAKQLRGLHFEASWIVSLPLEYWLRGTAGRENPSLDMLTRVDVR